MRPPQTSTAAISVARAPWPGEMPVVSKSMTAMVWAALGMRRLWPRERAGQAASATSGAALKSSSTRCRSSRPCSTAVILGVHSSATRSKRTQS